MLFELYGQNLENGKFPKICFVNDTLDYPYRDICLRTLPFGMNKCSQKLHNIYLVLWIFYSK